MSAMQVIPKNEIQPGDYVSIVGQRHSIHAMSQVVCVDGSIVSIEDGSGVRDILPDQIATVIRPVGPLL